MTAKYDDLRGTTDSLQTSMQGLKEQVERFVGPPDSSLSARMAILEQKLADITGGNKDLSLVLNRVQNLRESVPGQQQMQAAVTDLQLLVMGLQGRMDDMDTALKDTQQTGDSALAQTLEGVSPQELKAAAMLIGLSQFRDSMNRSGPFSEDLALLQTMLGDRDPELNEAIVRLAPYAEQGVLSPSGLSNELKTLTGDIVAASLAGEDISIQERAMARLDGILKIRKDGQPVMGTDAQATVARAQGMLDQGNIDGAIAELQSLQGPARDTAQPVIDQAEITRLAQQVQTMMTSRVLSQIKAHAGGGHAPYTATPALKIPGADRLFGPKVYTPPSTE
jgi:hypothetical protein